MSEITKNLGIAISDSDAGRITKEQLFEIFQEAINNGDINCESNEMYAVSVVLPLIDKGVLKQSKHTHSFEDKMNKKAMDFLNERKRKK